MKVLLDTCTFVWIAEGSGKISAAARALFESQEHQVYLSAVSAWEIGVKYAIRRMSLSDRPERLISAQRERHGIAELVVDEQAALHAARLPLLHKDPFDRLLVGQAIVHGMTILTPDPMIAQYSVRVDW